MANPQSSTVNRPDKDLVVGDTTLTMSYGMFSELSRIIGEPSEAVEILLSDTNSRELVIRRLFTPTTKAIETTDDLISVFEIDLDPYDMDQIVAWVADHMLHFTVSTSGKTKTVVEKYSEKIASLSPQKTGSPA